MAPPITWKNVNLQQTPLPNFGGELFAAQRGGEDLSKALRNLGGNVQDYATDKRQQETDAFIAELNAAPDDATRNQMVADAERAFLDIGAVNKAVTSAQTQDFELAKRNEEKLLFDQEQEVFASQAPLREKMLANSILTAKNVGTTASRKQQSLANAPAFEQAELEIANMPPGPERTSRIQQLRTDLSALPEVTSKSINQTFSAYHDDNLLNTPVSVEQYTESLPKINFLDREKVPSSAAITRYERKLAKVVKKDNRFASDQAVSDKVSEMLSTVPGYVQSKIDAAAIKKSTQNVIDVKVEKEAKVEQDTQERQIAIRGGSPVGDLTKLLQKNYPLLYGESKIPAAELENIFRDTWDNAQKEYAPELFKGEISKEDLLDTVYKMFTGSSAFKPWYYIWDNRKVSGPKGTKNLGGYFPDTSVDKLIGKQIRRAVNEFLPAKLRPKAVSEKELKKQEEELKKQEEELKKQETDATIKILENSLGKKIKPDKDGDVVLSTKDILQLFNPFN